MNILVITNMYPPHHYGGYELTCQDVVKRWRSNGHRVVVLTSGMRLPTEPHDDDEPDVERSLGIYMRGQALWSPPLRERLAIERRNQTVLKALLDNFHPDVVSVWNHAALSLGLLKSINAAGVPMCLVVCNDWLVEGHRWDAWMRLFQGRPLASFIARRLFGVPTTLPQLDRDVTVCFLSEWIRDRATARSPFKIGRSTVTYTGIEPRDFPGASDSAPWSWRIAYVGRLAWSKGVHVAIDAFAELPVLASLTIVGRGDTVYEASLREQAERLGVADRVTFCYAPRADLHHQYAAADVLIHPVLWDEPFGLVPVEAMACGTPVIATRTGGGSEYLVDGVNMLEVPKNDPQATAHAISRLADDSDLRVRLVDSGLKTARLLDVDQLAQILERWHAAAAERFARGEPAHARTPTQRLIDAGVIDQAHDRR